MRGEVYILFLRIAVTAEILCNAMAKECQNVDDVWVPSLLCRRSLVVAVVVVHGHCSLSLFIVMVVPIAISECERHHEEWDACRLALMKDTEVHLQHNSILYPYPISKL